MKRIFFGLATLLLLFPSQAFAAEEDFDPAVEFEQHAWIPIHIGPLDLSVTKAVAYLLLGTAVTILLGLGLMRWRLKVEPDERQTVGEMVYDIAQTQIAEQGLPAKAIGRWFPYVATLFLFIWTLNILGFIPLPLSDETVTVFGVELPTLGIYAATSSLSVTLALALMTFVFTHVEGIRANGPIRYFKSWIPEVPKGLVVPIAVLEVLGQFMRLISLSVRLFANMLAGHILILTFIGLIFVLGNIALAPISVAVGTIFYLFEVVIVVSIQAYIFAALSANRAGTLRRRK
jgi:F-type H+-transporting ATPase subunit a